MTGYSDAENALRRISARQAERRHGAVRVPACITTGPWPGLSVVPRVSWSWS